MNCLFVNLHEPIADSGGIEAVTGILCGEFAETYNINSFCLWQLSGFKESERYPFIESRSLKSLSISDISELLTLWEIDVVIVQAYNEMVPTMRTAINDTHRDIRLIYVLHSSPGWEFTIADWSNVKRMPKTQGLKGLIKAIGYPIFRYYHNNKTKNTYQRNYQLCDKIVLLSQNFVAEYQSVAGVKDSSKIISISNPCRYINKTWNICQYNKTKTVLIVSRLIETPKKISKALEIWKYIENDNAYDEWRLIIVGSGADEAMYSNYVKKNEMKRVLMVGRRAPVKYYKDAAIFMMTSEYEGFGLTLIEAQSFGCVPIVFNSFSSLPDIVQHNRNGVVVPYPNVPQYVNYLKQLMSDTMYRERLSKNALKDVERFSISNIGKCWADFLKKLVLLPY